MNTLFQCMDPCHMVTYMNTNPQLVLISLVLINGSGRFRAV